MATLYSSQAIADSSESTSGRIRVSTNSEALTGTNDTTAMTPAKVASYVASATGTVTGNLKYKGAYDASANSPVLTSSKKGDFYILSVAGTLAGVALNVGDHIVFNQDAASPITSAMFDVIDNTEAPASTTTAGVIEIATNTEAGAGSAGDKALVPSNVASLSIANTQVTGLGTASTASTGASAGNVIVLDGSAKLPAVDASQLTNLPSASAASTSSAGIIEIATNTEAGAGSATDKALVPSNVASLSIANTQVTGLGTASTASTGTSAGNVVVLDGSAKLPAIDGSQLTNLPSGSAASATSAGIIEIATNTEAGAGSASDKALVPSNVASLSIANTQVTGLGTASTASTGTSAGNVVVLDGSARLPAVDASQLTNLPSASAASTSAAGIIEIATNTEAGAGSASDKALVPSNVASLSIANTQVTGLGTASTAASTDFLSGTGTDTLGGDLDVGTSDIISASNNPIELAPHGTGVVTVKGNATGGSGQIKLNCEQNSHGVTIKGPPHSASATYTLTLPNDDGGTNQVLKSDGSGVLSWTDQASGGSAPVVAEQNSTATLSNPSSGVIEQVYTVSSSSAVTLTLALSATVGEGFKYQIKRLGTGAVTLTCGGSEYIDHSGQTSFAIPNQYDSITLVANGTSPASWLIV